MISTIESKQQQLTNGFFQRGTGSKKILILGSCRTLAYLSYLIRWNEAHGDEFTIRRIDPCDWTVEGVDIGSLKTDERILSVIQGTDIFIHEHLESYGMFNTKKDSETNIYQFGLAPPIEISIPNWHDKFILEKDYEACGITTPDDYIQRGEAEVQKFYDVCQLSSFPEFGDEFVKHWREIRYFWRPNHVSARFTLAIMWKINDRFLKLPLTIEFWNEARTEDLFKEPHTQVTQRDIEGYGLKWN